jgi:predicted Zn-dependent peptidase
MVKIPPGGSESGMSSAPRFFRFPALFLAAAGAAFPQAAARTAEIKAFATPPLEYRLKNGLRVILSEDETLPVVSVVVAYGAGAARDENGKGGLAYLMETLMFQGSENIGPMQHWAAVERVGGALNATTTHDVNVFSQTVAANQLGLVLWLESDRMRSLTAGPDVVEKAKEELVAENRQRRATDPFLETSFEFDRLLYGGFAAAHPIVGSEPEVKSLAEADIRAFYRTFFVPNNAHLCIVGAFNRDRTRDLIARYFETIPAGSEVPPLAASFPAAGSEEGTTRTVKNAQSVVPALHLGFRMSALQTGDRHALRVLEYLLIRGRSSRLQRRLVRRELVALSLGGGFEERAGALVFRVFATGNNEVMTERCRRVIMEEIARLKAEFVPADELESARNRLSADFYGRLATSLGRALALVEYARGRGNLSDWASDLDKFLRVNPQTLISLVNRHFDVKRSVVLNVEAR